MANTRDKEELLSALFVGYVVPRIRDVIQIGSAKHANADVLKRTLVKLRALERYMRTYLRAMTVGELEDELEMAESGHLSAELESKIAQASNGFDRYVSKRKYPSLAEV